jgi:hypothetical protein
MYVQPVQHMPYHKSFWGGRQPGNLQVVFSATNLGASIDTSGWDRANIAHSSELLQTPP